MLSINGLCTLTTIIIINPIQIGLVSKTIFFYGATVIIIVQTKDNIYHDQILADMFLPPTIEVFKCLCQ